MPHRDLPLHQRVLRLLKAAGQEFGEDKATRMAAALSFYTLFSLVPLLFLVVAVVGYVSEDSILANSDCEAVGIETLPADPANPLDRLLLQVDEVAGRQVADQLADLTCEAAKTARGALWIGIGLAAFSGSSIFLHVQGVLNVLFHAPEPRVSGITATLLNRGIALVSAILLAVLVIVPLVAVAGVNLIRELMPVGWLRYILGVAVPLTSLFLLVVVVALTFRLLPRSRINWQAARRGGMFTALTGLGGAFLVGLYLSRFGTAGTLGALGGAAILLFFFNLMWMIYLFGAEVTKVYTDYLRHGDVMAPSRRESASVRARTLEASAASTSDETPARTGVVAFLIGLVTGWAAGRRGERR